MISVDDMWHTTVCSMDFFAKNKMRFPLDEEEVAQKLNLDKPVHILRVSNLPDDIGGYVQRTEKRYYVLANKNHPVLRQRFSIFHEFGHFILGHRKTSIHAWYETRDIQEKEADYLAANLLMPLDIVYRLAERYWYNVMGLLDAVQSVCHVSLSAAAYRICNLGLFQGSIILKDGFTDCFRYRTPGYHERMGYRHYDRRTLLSGKTLHIHVLKTFPPQIP
ncbi:hypothetical protein Tfer_2760 [Thermincola ferriacetica]|uniref:IrrE N-terminal-like domain-containing protein n=1 Tax=Thermincola ferriacetica TaxID=281456 RepID=A0A0L6W0R1_9FIRM|nr:ImmA/IrrE family metallo-endopeptidase [Thermincola ferriacetica]KNZ68669.1 hypothetical protein Tfer_2760 [Thermincola ferriacetica]